MRGSALISRWVYGGPSVFAALSRTREQLQRCNNGAAAASVAAGAKGELRAILLARLGSPATEALTLKLLNLLLARRHFEACDACVLSRPFGLVVDPSNTCQLACPGCVHSTRNEALQVFDWPNGTLPEARFKALLEAYGPYAIGVFFCNYGEPLLNLSTPKFIRLAKAYLLSTALSTSLSVTRFDAGAYVESGLDFMALSIDGATQPVYRRFRRNGDLELVFSNVRKLVEAKRRLNRVTPVLSWSYLAFEHNAHEIPLALRAARKLGVDQFRVVRPFDVTWDDPEIRSADVKPRLWRVSWTSIVPPPRNWNPFPHSVNGGSIAHEFEAAWKGERTTDSVSSPAPGHTCHWLYKNMVMDSNGRILPCCCGPSPDTAVLFGIFNGKGSDAFNSEKYREARRWFTGDSQVSSDSPHCTRCEWDQTAVNIDGAQVRQYFQAVDRILFDRRSLNLLTGW